LLGLLFGSLALGDILLDFLLLFSRLDSLEWVQLFHESLVLEWVPSLSWMEGLFLFLVSQDTLDLVRVDDGVDVSVSDDLSLESVVSLFSRSLLRSELFGKLSHGTLSVDGESSELTTWSQGSEVESLDMDDVNTWDVSKSSGQLLSLVIDDNEWTLSHSVFLSSNLRDTRSDGLSINDSLDVLVTSESLQEGNSLFGLLDVVDIRIKNKWNLWDLVDLVTSGKDQWKNSSGRNSRGQSVSLQSEIDLSVPSSKGL
jgi:hypothetical protein